MLRRSADDVSTEMRFPQLNRELLSDKVYDVIRGSIVDGTFVPGEQIVESQLARQMSVSQAPMRDALRRLSHEGLVEIIPRRGTFVRSVSPEQAAEARIVRQALEAVAARTIAGHLGDDFARQLRAIVAEMRVAVEGHDFAGFRVLDADFHRLVIEASGNSILTRLWLQVEQMMFSLHVVSGPRGPDDYAPLADVHEGLVRLLESGDPERAARSFIEHSSRLPIADLRRSVGLDESFA